MVVRRDAYVLTTRSCNNNKQLIHVRVPSNVDFSYVALWTQPEEVDPGYRSKFRFFIKMKQMTSDFLRKFTVYISRAIASLPQCEKISIKYVEKKLAFSIFIHDVI